MVPLKAPESNEIIKDIRKLSQIKDWIEKAG
jgi:hypothetical protein